MKHFAKFNNDPRRKRKLRESKIFSLESGKFKRDFVLKEQMD